MEVLTTGRSETVERQIEASGRTREVEKSRGLREHFLTRAQTADWEVVFAAAARSRVAIEIDGDPSRQDVDYDLARAAITAGCLFALDSDAHGAAAKVGHYERPNRGERAIAVSAVPQTISSCTASAGRTALVASGF